MTMTNDDVLDVFREAGALLEGHFILSSGRHSPVFLQKALIFKNPVLTAKLCMALANKVRAKLESLPDVIIAPAMGGVIPGYEMARQLGLESMFMERERGIFTLRRGFSLQPGQTVLMVEDIITTGLSSRETIEAITVAGGNVVAGCCIFDRSGGEADIGVPLISLAAKRFLDYDPADLPPELATMEAIKPGSRGLNMRRSSIMRRGSDVRLGVNIDHVATIRNARGGTHPDPVEAANQAITAGADSITAHLREDRRHITDDDMERLAELCRAKKVPLNMELAGTEEMVEIAERLKPHAACIVPEKREERTTEGGLDVAGQLNRLVPLISRLADSGCRISLFIEAEPQQIQATSQTRAAVVEFHTGAYAQALDAGDPVQADEILQQLQEGGRLAAAAGLEVHYGHGLTFDNVGPIAAIPEAKELNIGHFIIGEMVFLGLTPAIQRMASIIRDARLG